MEVDIWSPPARWEHFPHQADVELLLVDWLNLLIYEMATRNMLFSRFEVHLEENRLTAQAW